MLEVRLCISQQFLHRRHRTGGDNVDLDVLLFSPAIDDRGRQIERIDHLLQEAATLAQAVDQPDVSVGTVLQQDGQDHAGEAGAGPEISPGQGLGRQGQQLGAVPGMAVPEVGNGVGADQVHHLIGLGQHTEEGGQIRDLGFTGARMGAEGGDRVQAHATMVSTSAASDVAFFTWARSAVRAPGVIPSMRPA
ncbi:hypothetical protein D3C80_947770 [compost metagenome]